ncbi:MAG: phenylalanine--tRNA ligase subunit beta [bacterium]
MKISLNWLKQFVEIPKNITPKELGIALTLKTVEVEGIEKQGENLENDVILDIDNKSLTHRPDLWSHYGIAREVAAIFPNTKYLPACAGRRHNTSDIKSITKKASKNFEISVNIKDHDLCPRYMALAMSGIKIEPSPQWMQNRLRSVGMRPINNIVDITNYVMLELGQPMHAFSKSKVKSQKSKVEIVIRRAVQDEQITTLDGVERKLDNSMLVIADSENPIAIAGVMGGENSEIDKNITEIILESANFNKVNNRKTSAKLGLRTEAVIRYEKGLDPALCEQALARCVELIKEIIPESVVSSDLADVSSYSCVCPDIEISLEYIQNKIGVEIKEKQVIEILESLGFNVEHKKNIFKISVPSWRATGDISIPDDIVEEVARIYGYDNILPQMPEVKLEPAIENKERILERKIKNILSMEFGMAETSNYSFVNEKQIENLGMEKEECLKLLNPISSEYTLLRPSLIPNLLENGKNNLRYFDKFKMFEIGSVFKDEIGDIESRIKNKELRIKSFLPWQEKFVSGIVVSEKKSVPFYKAKESAEGLLQELGIEYEITENEITDNWQHPYRKSKIINLKSKIELGYITELNPAVAEKIGIENARVAVFELSLKLLVELAGKEKKYKELPKYPSVIRDLAIAVDRKILYKDIMKIILGIDKLIKSVELFDIFESEKLGKDKKSMAFHITFLSNERTLTDGEVKKIFSEIVKKLKKEFGAEIRN